MTTKKLHGLRIDFIDFKELRNIIEKNLVSSNRNVINYANAYSLVLASENEDVRKSISSSDITFPDGTGVYLAARLLLKLSDIVRFNLTDHSEDLLLLLDDNKARIFLLGSTDETLEAAKSQIHNKYNNLKIVGSLNGYENISNISINETINNTQPDILLVGMGTPKQEMWVNENASELNAKVILCVGDLLTLYADQRRRGPAFFRKIGLEWLLRVIFYPDKYFLRYFITLPKFSFLLCKKFIKNKFIN